MQEEKRVAVMEGKESPPEDGLGCEVKGEKVGYKETEKRESTIETASHYWSWFSLLAWS